MKNEKNFTHRPMTEHIFHPNSQVVGDFDFAISSMDTPKVLRNVYAFDNSFVGEGVKIAVICALDNVALQQNMDVFCAK